MKRALLWLPWALFASAELPFGSDSDCLAPPPPLVARPKSCNPLLQLLQGAIVFHQRMISPVQGARSNFKPSSSHYARQALDSYGLIQGWLMACDRLMRENEEPWVYETIWYENAVWKFDPVR